MINVPTSFTNQDKLKKLAEDSWFKYTPEEDNWMRTFVEENKDNTYLNADDFDVDMDQFNTKQWQAYDMICHNLDKHLAFDPMQISS